MEILNRIKVKQHTIKKNQCLKCFQINNEQRLQKKQFSRFKKYQVAKKVHGNMKLTRQSLREMGSGPAVLQQLQKPIAFLMTSHQIN